MAGREQPYDPYIPSGGSGQGGSAGYEGGNTRTAAIQSVRAHTLSDFDGVCCAMDSSAGFCEVRAWCLHALPAPTTMRKVTAQKCILRDGTASRNHDG